MGASLIRSVPFPHALSAPRTDALPIITPVPDRPDLLSATGADPAAGVVPGAGGEFAVVGLVPGVGYELGARDLRKGESLKPGLRKLTLKPGEARDLGVIRHKPRADWNGCRLIVAAFVGSAERSEAHHLPTSTPEAGGPRTARPTLRDDQTGTALIRPPRN